MPTQRVVVTGGTYDTTVLLMLELSVLVLWPPLTPPLLVPPEPARRLVFTFMVTLSLLRRSAR
jgi:hypothetical protein